MRLKNCVVILSLLATLPLSADIYRCQTGDGKWLFTDRLCIAGPGQEVTTLPLMKTGKSEPVGLSEAELKALKDLDQRMAELRESRIKERKKYSIQIRNNNRIKQQNCALAVQQLDNIQARKTHGYKLSEAQSLDQRVRKLVEVKRINCR
jgi:hypothetical protein